MSRLNRHLLALMAIVSLAHACAKPTTRSGEAIIPYEVKWGTSGGFTGGGEGYILYTDGRLARWKQITPASEIEMRVIGKITPEVCIQIRQIIEENNLLKFNQLSSGNMTTTLTISSGGQDHRISWPGWPGEAPKELAALTAQLQAIVHPFKK